MLKFMVIGDKEHGKDTLCEYLEEKYGITFISSSKYASEKFLFEQAVALGMPYSTPEELYQNRGKHRDFFYNGIEDYCGADKARMGREILAKYDAYCGCRSDTEFFGMQDVSLFDYVIWVEAGKRKPRESRETMKLSEECADFVLDNNGPEPNLFDQADALMLSLDVYPI